MDQWIARRPVVPFRGTVAGFESLTIILSPKCLVDSNLAHVFTIFGDNKHCYIAIVFPFNSTLRLFRTVYMSNSLIPHQQFPQVLSMCSPSTIDHRIDQRNSKEYPVSHSGINVDCMDIANTTPMFIYDVCVDREWLLTY